jgi:hypothetical protein
MKKGLGEILKWSETSLVEEDGAPSKDSTANEEYRADQLSSVLRLVTHAKERKLTDQFQRIVMTLFLLSLLRRTTFFGGTSISVYV